MARQDPIDIAIDDGGGQSESKGADGGCRVVPYPFQGTDTLERSGETTLGDNLLGGSMQITGPTVIAQSLPFAQHLILRGLSQ